MSLGGPGIHRSGRSLRRGPLTRLLPWLALAFAFPGCSEPPTDEVTRALPRRVILISVDTLRADHLGVYGHSRFTSPILDTFALEGVVFEDASSTTAWTLPSHASMLTGLFPLSHGVVTADTALPAEVGTVAGWMREGGWETAAVVNAIWLKRDRFQLTRDFEKYLSIEDSDYQRRDPSIWITDQVIRWIDEQGDRPLFIFAHYYDVHADYASLPRFERLLVSPYEGRADGTGWQIERANFAEEHIALCLREFDPSRCQFGSAEKPRRIDADMERVEFEAEDIRHLEELYDAGIRQLDSELGRLFGDLEERGLADDTLVIITSDHGEEFMEHGRLSHFLTTYQQSLHVPLLMRGPGIPAGVRVGAPVSLVDLAPTLLGLTGLPPRDFIEGLDLSVLMQEADETPFLERSLYGEASGGLQHERGMPGVYPVFRSIRRGAFKLIEERKGESVRYFLFDIENDPREAVDVASLHRELTASLTRELASRPLLPDERGEGVELSEDEIERLRALGYVP